MSAIDQYLNDHPETKRRMRQRPSTPLPGDAAPQRTPANCTGDSDTALVLDQTRDWFARYIRTQRPEDLDAITLWAAHTHLLRYVPVSPRMIIDSLMPGAGKTTLLEHLNHLCHMPVVASGISSPALIPRMIAAEGDQSISVLIDEADRTLDPKKEGVGDLIAVINSGSKRGATRPVLVPDKENGWKAQNMPTYSAVAMAGNSPTLPDDTRSRSIQVFLLPDTSDSIEETDWVSDETMDTASRRIHDMLAAWAESRGNDIQAVRPVLPDGCKGRMKERWITFAKIAAMSGGRWPGAVTTLVLDDIERVEAEKADGLNTLPPKALLVQDCLDVMQQDFTPTATLVGRLAMSQPERWGSESPYGSPLTRQRLAKMLSPMGVHSKQGTTRENRIRGYLRADIEKVSQSLTTQPRGAHGSHSAHGSPPVHHVNHVNDVNHVPEGQEASFTQNEEMDF
ncbi:MAG: DUF3631 domain-containing protein [Bifidobacterium crudilactis]|uniref:DUF3631 domain-containing protein n=1 Tax=Bifidobacterium crudilactis TaxID=327277 RepID=A0A971CZ07_9BIFI|nr:DUF3631 domain-containing protein [Bifidobacterium crudilactis]